MLGHGRCFEAGVKKNDGHNRLHARNIVTSDAKREKKNQPRKPIPIKIGLVNLWETDEIKRPPKMKHLYDTDCTLYTQKYVQLLPNVATVVV